jgi:hypothetical protein
MLTRLTRIALALAIITTAGCVYSEGYGRYDHDDDRYEHHRYGDQDCDDDDYGSRGCRRGENDQGENEQ